MGDLPFIVYFDFEMTTGDSVLHDQKIYFISYCQIYAFHPKLKLPKILVFSSFQQNFDQITSLHHQSQEHIPYFDQITMSQMKETAMRVLYKENTVALTEIFVLWLKFAIDTPVKCFNSTIKAKFLELGISENKNLWRKKSIRPCKNYLQYLRFKLCLSFCKGHKETLNLTTWFDFIVQQEYLFLKNIRKCNDFETLECFYESFKCAFEIVTLFKNENFKLQEIEQEKFREFLENFCAY